MMPTIPVYDENNPGGYGYGDAAKYNTFGVNPIARENLEKLPYETKSSEWFIVVGVQTFRVSFL